MSSATRLRPVTLISMRWESKNIDGKTYWVARQDQQLNCGIACIAMVRNLLTGGGASGAPMKVTSAMTQDLLPKQTYGRATKDLPGAQPTPLAGFSTSQLQSRQTYSSQNPPPRPPRGRLQGIRPTGIEDGLRGAGLAYTRGGGDASLIASALLQASELRPLIIEVRWPNGGLHWVVAVGHTSTRRIIVLDPAYGVCVSSQNFHQATSTVRGTWLATWFRVDGLLPTQATTQLRPQPSSGGPPGPGGDPLMRELSAALHKRTTQG